VFILAFLKQYKMELAFLKPQTQGRKKQKRLSSRPEKRHGTKGVQSKTFRGTTHIGPKKARSVQTGCGSCNVLHTAASTEKPEAAFVRAAARGCSFAAAAGRFSACPALCAARGPVLFPVLACGNGSKQSGSR